jgi:hypothetical protein
MLGVVNINKVITRLLHVIVFITATVTCFGQLIENDSITMVAYWSEGDSLYYQKEKYTYREKNGEVTADASSTQILLLDVVSETDSNYILRLSTLRSELDPKPEFLSSSEGMELEVLSNLVYEIETTSYGEIIDLINWEEMRDQLDLVFAQIIKDQSEDDEGQVETLERLRETMLSKDVVKSMVLKDLYFLFSAYGYQYDIIDSVDYETQMDNPFGEEPFNKSGYIAFGEPDTLTGLISMIDDSQIDPEQGKIAIISVLQSMIDDQDKKSEIESGLQDVAFNINDRLEYIVDYYDAFVHYAFWQRDTKVNDLSEQQIRRDRVIYSLIDRDFYSQYFEGEVLYEFDMIDKTGEVSSEQLQMVMGDYQTFTIKGNKYKNTFDGMLELTQIYDGRDTIFQQMIGVPNLQWIDATTYNDQIIDSNITENADTIAGYNCHRLTVTTAKEKHQYYYSPYIVVNPDNYRNHKYGFWDYFVRNTNSIPLKAVNESDTEKITIEAVEVNEMKIGDYKFELPDLPKIEFVDE